MSSGMYSSGMSSDELAEAIATSLMRLRQRRRPERVPDGTPEGASGRGAPDRASEGVRRPGRGPGGPAQVRLLVALAEGGVAMGVSDVAELIGVDQPRASRLVAQGVEQGLLERELDPGDARRTRIHLTEQGRGVAERVLRAQRDRVAQAMEALSPEERAQFAELLARFAAAWPG